MALNGMLTGIVGITAGADVIPIWDAALVGAIAGVVVVFSILILDRCRIDDPVGAISVHGVCGIWGTLAVGLFSINEQHTLPIQLKGALSYAAFAFLCSALVSYLLKRVMRVRVSEEEEVEGLDIVEHKQKAYPDFQIKTL